MLYFLMFEQRCAVKSRSDNILSVYFHERSLTWIWHVIFQCVQSLSVPVSLCVQIHYLKHWQTPLIHIVLNMKWCWDMLNHDTWISSLYFLLWNVKKVKQANINFQLSELIGETRIRVMNNWHVYWSLSFVYNYAKSYNVLKKLYYFH